ncbi:MAG: hypothetical protein GF328_15340 [Candidatus Latescibacteria bacterium]|nr:hypothetical protein [Candidatus Latescibacterota bacterium]
MDRRIVSVQTERRRNEMAPHGIRVPAVMISLLALLGLLGSSGVPAAGAGPVPEVLERVGSWPYGQSLAVAADPDRGLTYVGTGGAVYVVDTVDPANPVLVSDALHTLGLVLDIHYDAPNRRLFLACGEGGLEIWDVGDPLAPVQLSVTEVLDYGYETPIDNVDVWGDYAIVDCGWGHVRSLDVSDPTNPVVVYGTAVMGSLNDIYVGKDGLLHTVGSNAYYRFRINADGSLSANGFYDQWTGASFLVAGNTRAAFATNSGYLYVLVPEDVIEPVQSVYEVGHNLTDLDVQGDVVYYVRGYDRDLTLLDVSDLENPTFLGSVVLGGGPHNIDVNGTRVSLGDGYAGLSTVDTSDPTDPVELGTFDTFSRTSVVIRRGAHLFSVDHEDGMLVFDVTDLAHPALAARYDPPGLMYDLVLDGDRAYATAYEHGLRVVDISDPLDPVEIGVAAVPNANLLDVSGSYAYVTDAIANGPCWLRIYDVTDPGSMTEVGSLLMPELVHEVEVVGPYAYVAAGDSGLRIIDVSDPEDPFEAAVYSAPDLNDVQVVGTYAYLASADWDGGFLVLDVEDPLNPTLIGQYSATGRFFRDLFVLGDFAYVTAPSSDLLYVLQIADRTNPTELATYTPPGGTFDVAAQDSLLYVADGSAGVLILENTLYTVPGGDVGWEPQESGTDEHLRCVDFVDEEHGWIAGDGGTILSTSDGGETWSPQSSGTGEDLFAVDFVDALRGWTGGREGVLRATTDGGATWTSQNPATTAQIRALAFADENVGWAVGTGGIIRKTTNGGATWIAQNSGTSEALMTVCFVGAEVGWASGWLDGRILKTTNGGETWLSENLPVPSDVASLDFFDAQLGWASTYDNEIFHTTDGGSTWEAQYSHPEVPYSTISGVAFPTPEIGWAVGGVETFGQSFRTTDGGDTWTEAFGGHDHYLQSLSFADERNGWAVGHDGTILRTIQEPAGIEEDGPVAGIRLALHAGSPNPFRDATALRYSIGRRTPVRLAVYDLLGREVRTLVDGPARPGTRTVVWNGTDDAGRPLPAGIYVTVLEAEGTRRTGKVTLLR